MRQERVCGLTLRSGCCAAVLFKRPHHAFKRFRFFRIRLPPPIESETLAAIAAPNLNTFVVAVTEYLHLTDPLGAGYFHALK